MSIKGMKKISFVWGAILVIIVIGLTVIGFVYKNKSNDYKNMEKNLVEITKKYVELKFLYPDPNQKLKISFSELKQNDLIEELKKDDQECDGYVIIKNNGTAYEYKGYVSCPNYSTKGYEN